MNYRTTRIYLRALDLVDVVALIAKRSPAKYSFLADQLRRAAASVPLNYMEGCGRTGRADRRRFFDIAIGSAQEASGAIEVMERFKILSAQDRKTGQDICDHLVAMLRRFH